MTLESSNMFLPKLNTQSVVPLGQLVATPNVMALIDHCDILRAIYRHRKGDWGEVCPEDSTANDQALKTGGRLLSRFTSSKGVVFWIITEADRSVTTVLLPEEY